MQFIIDKKILQEGISITQRAISPRVALPILNNILIDTKKDNIRLASTDLEISIEYNIPTKIKKVGAITVPSKLFSEIINNLPEKDVKIELEEMKNIIRIECGKGIYRLNVLSAEEFPLLPDVKEGIKFSLRQKIIKNLIRSVIFAVAPSIESRVVLTGVLFTIEDGKIKMIATNAHRLVLNQKTTEDINVNFSVIVPGKTLQELARIIEKDDEDLEILISENQIRFKTEKASLYSRLIDGQFPAYQQVIPTEHQKRWAVPTQELVKSVKGASSIALEDTGVIMIKVENNQLEISAVTQDIGEAKETFEIKQEGEDMGISFNVEYFLDFLTHVESKEIIFELIDELSAALLYPSDNKDYLYVIMPIRVG